MTLGTSSALAAPSYPASGSGSDEGSIVALAGATVIDSHVHGSGEEQIDLQLQVLHPPRSIQIVPWAGVIGRRAIADLAVLDADPLADTRNTQRVHPSSCGVG